MTIPVHAYLIFKKYVKQCTEYIGFAPLPNRHAIKVYRGQRGTKWSAPRHDRFTSQKRARLFGTDSRSGCDDELRMHLSEFEPWTYIQ
jgi:hypothetical protein